MRSFTIGLAAALALSVSRVALAQAPPAGTPTFRVTSRLVYLDVTVLDRKGHPVVSGLTRDDFTITESKTPQHIFSFDPPETHVNLKPADENPSGQAPLTVFVLDLLNSRFADFAYIRNQVRKYLASQPERLSSRAELMVLSNDSLEMLQGYTRNKEDLLSALNHLPPAFPYKLNGPFMGERFVQSIDALQEIALQNRGVPGRKNLVWIGHGGPGWLLEAEPASLVTQLKQYVHDTTNLLVDARISLFVIYPGLRVYGDGFTFSALSAEATLGDDDPFAGDINFGVFVNETGGNLFYNRNDVANEINRSQALGSEYYTLTYEPPPSPADGRFRRVRVTVKNPDFRVLTKAGYFAPEADTPVHPRKQRLITLAEALQASIPFPALPLKIDDVVRHPDSGRVEFKVVLPSGILNWESDDQGKSTTGLMLAAASLKDGRGILAYKAESLTVTSAAQNPAQLEGSITKLPLSLRIPPQTRSIRVAVETAQGGRIGSVELDRKTLESAPEAPTPQPRLLPRGPKANSP